jgi:predicted  nucleic acid-binding Zn-ribbon protein
MGSSTLAVATPKERPRLRGDMGLGSTAKKLQTLADTAEKLYERLNDLRDRVVALEERTAEARDRIEDVSAEQARQRALVEAVAEEQGVDVEAVLSSVDVEERTPGDEDEPDPEAADASAE